MKPHAAIILVLAAAITATLPAAPPPTAAAQTNSTSALINKALDERIAFNFQGVALPQVLKSIEEQTGVPVRPTNDVYDLLPFGTRTTMSVTLELPLGQALEAMCSKIGLRVNLREEYVELSPEPALRRIGRRATLQELRTLDTLNGRKLNATTETNPTLVDLAQRIDASLATYDTELKTAGKPPAKLVLELRAAEGVDPTKLNVRLPRDVTLRAALDAIAEQSKLTWYPWGDSIVVLPKRNVIRNQLDRPLSLRYDGVDVAQVLADLSARTGVDFMIEPGAIQRVTPEFRIIKMIADAPVRQSLESLQGYTGLGYVVTDEGVYIWNQNSTPQTGRGRVVATVEIAPGVSILVYEDQLSPEAREAINAKRAEAAKSVERGLTGSPTSQPTHFN